MLPKEEQFRGVSSWHYYRAAFSLLDQALDLEFEGISLAESHDNTDETNRDKRAMDRLQAARMAVEDAVFLNLEFMDIEGKDASVGYYNMACAHSLAARFLVHQQLLQHRHEKDWSEFFKKLAAENKDEPWRVFVEGLWGGKSNFGSEWRSMLNSKKVNEATDEMADAAFYCLDQITYMDPPVTIHKTGPALESIRRRWGERDLHYYLHLSERDDDLIILRKDELFKRKYDDWRKKSLRALNDAGLGGDEAGTRLASFQLVHQKVEALRSKIAATKET